jgi:hypothetical protein
MFVVWVGLLWANLVISTFINHHLCRYLSRAIGRLGAGLFY